jgi:hypothetical protein
MGTYPLFNSLNASGRVIINSMDAIHASNTPGEIVYTSNEIARARKLHPSTVRSLFIDEPGVIRLGHPRGPGRRQRFTLRIPHSVVERVFSRLTVPGDDSAN